MVKNITIIGAGFAGLSLAAAILDKSKKNYKLTIIKKRNKEGSNKVKKINSGNFPLDLGDSKLQSLFKKYKKKIKATINKSAIKKSDVVIFSINFDINLKSKKGNLNFFLKQLIPYFKLIGENTLVIFQTTLPPGTCEKLIYPLLKKNLLKNLVDIKKVFFSYSPERVTPGENVVESITKKPRIYAAIDKVSEKKCRNFLLDYVLSSKKNLDLLKDIKSAELSKIIENSYRATNIAFIHEWQRFADTFEIDLNKIVEVIRKRKTHQNIMKPGLGFGGYCLTKDPFMGQLSKEYFFKKKEKFLISNLAFKISKKMNSYAISKVTKSLKKENKKVHILIMGASYKSNVNDTRYSPSYDVFKELSKSKNKISVYDPKVKYWKEAKIKCINKMPKLEKYDYLILINYYKAYDRINFIKLLELNTKIFDLGNTIKLF